MRATPLNSTLCFGALVPAMKRPTQADSNPPFTFLVSESGDHLQIHLTEDTVRHILVFPSLYEHRLTVTVDYSSPRSYAHKAPLDNSEEGGLVMEWVTIRADPQPTPSRAGATLFSVNAFLETPKRQKRAFPSTLSLKQPSVVPVISPSKTESRVTEPESDTGNVYDTLTKWGKRGCSAPTGELSIFPDIHNISLIQHIHQFYLDRGATVPFPLLHTVMAFKPVVSM
ncbi:hypothetical protein K488DRAFT_73969 [Vararia minispora EC-137]|uniref:Uncharacterized protein n=1 Tax=Vararia minispora EC-137 TaxID=1314806 RepID=A0ACB8Q8Y6_9AGAM|nr:hypothetical protein K488DRAFT_73969 [Vararia minispora EC-137]